MAGLSKGYAAGVPFPNPSDPDKAAKVMYNAWLVFRPSISHYYTYDWIVDQYDNVSKEETDDTWYQLSHISEPGSPVNLPYANGMLFAARYLVAAPEQSKYSTELQLQPADPNQFQESYVFLPSLRRSLRLSSAARCSPILGTDYVQDDGGWMPTNFDAHYLGSKKLLTLIIDPAHAYSASTYLGGGNSSSGSLPGWPKAGTNKWELRTYDVIDLQPFRSWALIATRIESSMWINRLISSRWREPKAMTAPASSTRFCGQRRHRLTSGVKPRL